MAGRDRVKTMFRRSLTAIAVLALSFVGAAHAQKIRSECAKMRDKIACTCALNNGGCISQDGRHWFSVCGHSPNNNALPNQRFTDCIRRARGG
jgi:hypothetical protein